MSNRDFTAAHEEFRMEVRAFVEKELTPNAERWNKEKQFPKDVFRKLGEKGYLGLMHPKKYGGSEKDIFYTIVLLEELAHCHPGGLGGSIAVHSNIALPPLLHLGSEELIRDYFIPAIKGEKVGALAVTEPGAGSDVGNITTFAESRDGYYRINGAKIFITNGCIADFLTLLVKTDKSKGVDGCSLILFDTKTPGFKVDKKLNKIGAYASDTAELSFTNCDVPKKFLLGEEGQGFFAVMRNFQLERLLAGAVASSSAQLLLNEILTFITTTKRGGKVLASRQSIRHRIAELATQIEVGKQLGYHAAWLYQQKMDCVREVSMAKYFGPEMVNKVANAALEIFGEEAYGDDHRIAHAIREARIFSIAGGTSEIMKEVIAGIVIDQKKVDARIDLMKGKGEEKTLTGEELIQSLPGRLRKERVEGWDTTFHFSLSGDGGGEWTVVIHDQVCEVSEGLIGTPKCTIKADSATFVGVQTGTINPQTAFMEGKIVLDNIDEMFRFIKSFRREI